MIGSLYERKQNWIDKGIDQRISPESEKRRGVKSSIQEELIVFLVCLKPLIKGHHGDFVLAAKGFFWQRTRFVSLKNFFFVGFWVRFKCPLPHFKEIKVIEFKLLIPILHATGWQLQNRWHTLIALAFLKKRQCFAAQDKVIVVCVHPIDIAQTKALKPRVDHVAWDIQLSRNSGHTKPGSKKSQGLLFCFRRKKETTPHLKRGVRFAPDTLPQRLEAIVNTHLTEEALCVVRTEGTARFNAKAEVILLSFHADRGTDHAFSPNIHRGLTNSVKG